MTRHFFTGAKVNIALRGQYFYILTDRRLVHNKICLILHSSSFATHLLWTKVQQVDLFHLAGPISELVLENDPCTGTGTDQRAPAARLHCENLRFMYLLPVPVTPN